MKGFNVAKVFCEVLSGLAIMFFVIPLLDLIGTRSICESFTFIWKNLSATTIGGTLILAYILGLVMDALGLAVGEWFLNGLLYKEEASENEKAEFWKNVSSHVLAYRDTQWTYTSAYRNLAILTVPGGVFWFLCVGKNYGWFSAIFVILGMIVMEVVFLKSIAELLKIYDRITRAAAAVEAGGQPAPL